VLFVLATLAVETFWKSETQWLVSRWPSVCLKDG